MLRRLKIQKESSETQIMLMNKESIEYKQNFFKFKNHNLMD